ncbi:DUF4352 domain-containing protein [Oceanobacillus damuensis]|uniref:DUF4352 domain-containing protein n=1 Tax=Oceanobacillus damuensis TaxID=937928 RepID=UPI00082B74A3|nr:DUF4352 domain-containing protein [Oceanobacillus damuensis]
MEKVLKLLSVLILCGIILVACSNENNTENNNKANDNETEESEESQSTDITTEDSTSESEEQDENTESEEQTKGGFSTGIEDQLGFAIGDTGQIDSDLTTYEITLDGAKIIEGELDGEESLLDHLILLDITLKNTGEDTQTVKDLMYGLEVTEDMDKTGRQDGAEYFESVEEMTGKLAPGNEVKGQFITDIYEAEEYYFRLRSGISGSGSSNQVIWTIPAEEVQW